MISEKNAQLVSIPGKAKARSIINIIALSVREIKSLAFQSKFLKLKKAKNMLILFAF